MLLLCTGTDPEDVIRNAFACFDEENTGKINEDRLRELLTTMGDRFTDAEVCDSDGGLTGSGCGCLLCWVLWLIAQRVKHASPLRRDLSECGGGEGWGMLFLSDILAMYQLKHTVIVG